MKVLLVTDCMDVGGAETHIATLSRKLMARGIGVGVLSSGGRTADVLRAEGIEQYTISFSDRSVGGIFSTRRTLRRLVEEGDFSILHAHARYPAFLLRGCERWRGNPLCLVTAHAAFENRLHGNRIYHWGYRTVAVSEDLRALLCDRFDLPAERVQVIPNGIDTHIFHPSSGERIPPHSILFASRLDEDCSLGAELLCNLAPILAERYPDLQITIAGGGALLSYFFDRAQQINRGRGSPILRTVGSVSDMPLLLRQSRVFVGVSRAALEAAASGCAVLLVGNEGGAGLLSPQNPAPALSNFCCRGMSLPTEESLFEDLCRLFDSESLLRISALAGRKWVTSSFDAERVTDETVALYQKMQAEKSFLGRRGE